MRGTSSGPQTTSSGSSAHTFRTKLAKLLLGSLVAQYGNASSVPQHEIDAVRMLYPQADCECALKEAEHLWMRAAAKAASGTESAPAAIARTARRPQTAGPSLTSPRLHAYIHGRTNAEARRLSLRRRAVEDSQNLRRVLNEIQQRMPSLRKLAQQRNIDLDTEEGQVAGFADIFTLIDEDGSGGVTAEEFIAFGRRVGGESARVFSRELFSRVDRQAYEKSKSDTDGGISKEQFIAVLFPRYWARKRQQQEELRRREEAAQALPPVDTQDDMAVMKRIFGLCDAAGKGVIGVSDLRRVYPQSDSREGGDRYSLQAMLNRVDADHDGYITFEEFHQLVQPAFEASRQQRQPPIELFFQNVRARW